MENRRGFLLKSVGFGVGALALGKVASRWFSSADAAEQVPYAKLAQVAADCVRTGDACIRHCQKELAVGKTEMAKCNASTHEMVAISQAMLALASYESPRAQKLVSLFAESCKACAESCEEHKAHWSMGMHLECKACFEACGAALQVCKSV